MQIDPQIAVPQSIYKLLIGCVVPRPIAWVSSLGEDAVPNLAPFSFFMAVCNDPPTLAFASGRRAGNKKDTVRNIEHTQDFVAFEVYLSKVGFCSIIFLIVCAFFIF
jgi:flavin reductase (DIM6/NTAB) family NADH-FMN oxidoreductase RutF